MSTVPTKLYSYHVANLRELQVALNNIERLARQAIASRDPQQSLRTLLRMYAFLIGAWAESRLKKLLHEDSGFTSSERGEIEREKTQLSQWQKAIDLSFRKHFKIPRVQLDKRSLGVAEAARRVELLEVLNIELRIVIEIRNKLAHGQWIYPLTNDGATVEQDKYKLINQENLQSLQFKLALVGHMANAVHDLVVSPKTFDRDFEAHFRKIFQVRVNLRRKKYANYEEKLVSSRARARNVANITLKPAPAAPL